MVMGDEDKRTKKSAKSDPLATTLEKKPEKKGAAPPEKLSLTQDEPNLLTSYRTKKAMMADNTVQTSESDKGNDIDPPPGGTPSRNILAPKTPDHGGEADSSKEDKDNTLIQSGSHQGLQVPKLTVGGKTIRTPKGKESRSINSEASSKGSRTSRTRGDTAQIAAGKPLEENFSKKQEKKGAGRGRAPPQRRASIVESVEVRKLEKEAKAAKLAAEKADKENAGKSKRSETGR
jgi:hypothetical protein